MLEEKAFELLLNREHGGIFAAGIFLGAGGAWYFVNRFILTPLRAQIEDLKEEMHEQEAQCMERMDELDRRAQANQLANQAEIKRLNNVMIDLLLEKNESIGKRMDAIEGAITGAIKGNSV